VKAGYVAYFFPSSVIKGMLAGIGFILILKQFPHAIGYDIELFGAEAFDAGAGENTFTLLCIL
jgi:SulP family sulfate permease